MNQAVATPRSKLAKPAGVLFLLLCAAWYYHETVTTMVPVLPNGSDFTAYHEAARNVLAGHSPFRTAGYIYPPFLAFLLTPLAPFPYLTARYIWFVFSQMCLLGAGWVMWRAMSWDWVAAISIAFVWALGGAAQENLGWGQPGSELTLLVAIAITQPVTRHGWRAASAVGTGVALKLFPGVWAALFLLRRQWRALLVSGAVGAVLMLLPWSMVACCLDGPRVPGATDTWSGTPAVMSWGIPSVVLRVLDPPSPGGPLPRDWDTQLPDLRLPASHRWSSIGAAFSTLAVGIAILAVKLRRTGLPQHDSFAMAALVSLSVAASPVSWYHYQELQYPGLALLLAHALRSRRWGMLTAVISLGALLCPVPLAAIDAYYGRYGSLTVSLPALYLLTSVAPLASLALFGLFLRERR
jgi:hypothetical protein